LLTFFAAAKKVSAAPHRGNARAPARHRGCPQRPKQTRNRETLNSHESSLNVFRGG